MEVTVSPESPVEVRRVTLMNHDSKAREVELDEPAPRSRCCRGKRGPRSPGVRQALHGDRGGPPGGHALLARRRPRSADQNPIWAVHVVAGDAPPVGDPQHETDRARFLGRGRSTADPAALDPGAVLSGATGAVLDPILSLRRRVRISPGGSAVVAFATALASSREDALKIADQHADISASSRAFELAWAQAQVEHRQRNLAPADAHLFQRLAAHIVFAGPALRSRASAIAANRQGNSGLWRHGISGDLPIIVLVRIGEGAELGLARQALAAHGYLRRKGLEFDLVIWNEEPSSYLHELNESLAAMVRESDSRDLVDKPGGVFVRKAAYAADEDKSLRRPRASSWSAAAASSPAA